YIHSEAYAAGEMKHGTISLISDGTPVIAIATNGSLLEKTLSNVKEVKSRGAKVVLLCCDRDYTDSSTCDHIIWLPELNELFSPFTAIAALQLLSYYTAVLRGCDVDRPRNLAKSVTVE
ncbi:MAG: SIS domain-containing protein, partial [Clostridia bacterium]